MMPRLRHVLLMGGLVALYFTGGKFGLEFFGLVHPSASAVWPPTGISIAALILCGYRVWPAIFIGAFLVNITTAGSVATSIGIATGNTIEGLAAAFLVNRYCGGSRVFERARDILKFAGLAAIGSTVIAAGIGVASLTLGGYASAADTGAIGLTWWLGDAAGAVLITPLVMLWALDPELKWTFKRFVEAQLLFATVIAIGGILFFHPVLGAYPLAFLCLPPLVWAAFRFGRRETATAIGMLAVLATWATVAGVGPFVMRTPNESLLVLQAFMAMIAITTLSIAALVHERALALERERAARAEAEAANRSKDAFLATLSHELRNPLNAIAAAANVLESTARPVDEGGRWRKIIQRQTEHLTRLIDDLLDVARIAVGKMALRRQPVDLAEVARACLLNLASARALQRHRMDVQLRSVWVDADPHRLNQIITNLVNNAVRHTPPDGAIRVRTADEGEHALLRVEDGGAGISAELLPQVFDPFTQGEQGPERAHGGLGVGLTLVRQLAELHGGRVEAHSAGRGRGSTFTVRLPRSLAPITAHSAAAAAVRAGRSCRILLVEEHSDARESLRVLLEIMGHEVHEAADGQAGVQAAGALRPVYALVDVGLPRMAGYEVARRIKVAHPDVRLIAVTGCGEDDDQERAKAAGFDAYLLTPVRPEQLQRVMDELFTGAELPADRNAAA